MSKKIYIAGPVPRSIHKFVRKFMGLEDGTPTSSYFMGIKTFSNPECTTVQCYPGKQRSFEDLVWSTQTYFKSATRERVLRELLSIKATHGSYEFQPQFGYCGGIRRIKLYFTRGTQPGFHTLNRRGGSEQTWEDLFATIGLKNIAAVRDYIKANKKP